MSTELRIQALEAATKVCSDPHSIVSYANDYFAFLRGLPASAIEARSDATGTGAAEGESAVPKADAPKFPQ